MGYYPHFILPMRSSRGFASTATDLVALFGLAFASDARQRRLSLLVTVSRRIIMQKARHHSSVAVSYQLSAFSQTLAAGGFALAGFTPNAKPQAQMLDGY